MSHDIMTMDVVGIDRARTHLADLVQRVAAGPILITRNGEAAAVLVDADDYRALAAWAETYANPEFHRQMAEVARNPHESIADDDLEGTVEKIRRSGGA
jgi:prevent-host-death family protein